MLEPTGDVSICLDVLVVGHDPTTSRLIAAAMRHRPFVNVTTVLGPADLAACDADDRFDVVFADLRLDTAGVEIIERLRRCQCARSARLALITADIWLAQRRDDTLAALDLDDLILKPFALEGLFAIVDEAVEQRRRARPSSPPSPSPSLQES